MLLGRDQGGCACRGSLVTGCACRGKFANQRPCWKRVIARPVTMDLHLDASYMHESSLGGTVHPSKVKRPGPNLKARVRVAAAKGGSRGLVTVPRPRRPRCFRRLPQPLALGIELELRVRLERPATVPQGLPWHSPPCYSCCCLPEVCGTRRDLINKLLLSPKCPGRTVTQLAAWRA